MARPDVGGGAGGVDARDRHLEARPDEPLEAPAAEAQARRDGHGDDCRDGHDVPSLEPRRARAPPRPGSDFEPGDWRVDGGHRQPLQKGTPEPKRTRHVPGFERVGGSPAARQPAPPARPATASPVGRRPSRSRCARAPPTASTAAAPGFEGQRPVGLVPGGRGTDVTSAFCVARSTSSISMKPGALGSARTTATARYRLAGAAGVGELPAQVPGRAHPRGVDADAVFREVRSDGVGEARVDRRRRRYHHVRRRPRFEQRNRREPHRRHLFILTAVGHLGPARPLSYRMRICDAPLRFLVARRCSARAGRCAATSRAERKYPARRPGCALAVFYTATPGVPAWDDSASFRWGATSTRGRWRQHRLRVEACRMGGDILYNLPKRASRPGERR